MVYSKLDVYERIKLHFEDLILNKAYLPNEPLPSVRAVALEFGVNPNTVQKSYQCLQDEGLIEIIPKKGAFVSNKPLQEHAVTYKALEALLHTLKKHASDEEILKHIHHILKEASS